MGITLLHAGLAAGAATAVIPIILHLFMRRTPKKVVFPALRLVRKRHSKTTKRLKIKNWMLLLTRMGMLALMATALARPACNTKASLGDREVPTALALVFDTSYSMQYTEKGKDRLAEAKELAIEKMRRVSDSSQVFVFDSADAGAPPALSPAAARKRIEALALRPAGRPLNAAVGQAYASLAESELPRKVVYILTDLAASAWDSNREIEHLDLAKKTKGGISTFLVRLGAKKVQDVAIVAAEPISKLGFQGETATIKVRVRSTGAAASRVLDFFIDGKKKLQKSIQIPADGEIEVPLETPKLEPGPHQGEAALEGAVDPLKFNDKRFFTLEVQSALKVMVVSDLNLDADYVAKALDPSGERRPYAVERMLTTQPEALSTDTLRGIACVFMINVAKLDEARWSRLNNYVHEGGGVVIAVGDRADAENYNGPIPAQFSPAELKKIVEPADHTTFAKFDETHPLFADYAKDLERDLSAVPVFRYWSANPLQGSRAILTYRDAGAAALIERSVGGMKSGKTMLWTTPLARRAERRTERDLREGWNEFPLVWPFFYLVNQAVPYLAGKTGKKLNYEAGENVYISIDPATRSSNYIVQGPRTTPAGDKAADRLSPPSNNSALTIVSPQPEGQWSVTASGAGTETKIELFSVNIPPAESSFVRLEPKSLDGLFGKKNYQVAETLEDLKQIEIDQWIGKEIFPWLMALVVALVTVEAVVANRFYREPAGVVPQK